MENRLLLSEQECKHVYIFSLFGDSRLYEWIWLPEPQSYRNQMLFRWKWSCCCHINPMCSPNNRWVGRSAYPWFYFWTSGNMRASCTFSSPITFSSMKIGHFLKGDCRDSSQRAQGSYSLSPLSTGNDGNTAVLGMTEFLAPRTSRVQARLEDRVLRNQ
jgi:hypothetical protein